MDATVQAHDKAKALVVKLKAHELLAQWQHDLAVLDQDRDQENQWTEGQRDVLEQHIKQLGSIFLVCF